VSERGVLFLFSLGVITACLVAAVWLVATGQAAYIDGLFLLLCCLVIALAFALYLKYLIGVVTQAAARAASPEAKVVPGGRERSDAPARSGETVAKTG
jgi:hypothetical protein